MTGFGYGCRVASFQLKARATGSGRVSNKKNREGGLSISVCRVFRAALPLALGPTPFPRPAVFLIDLWLGEKQRGRVGGPSDNFENRGRLHSFMNFIVFAVPLDSTLSR